jgi:cytochrome c oxidase subunit 4
MIGSATLVFVCLGLLALTALTVGMAQISLGGWNVVIALGIAVMKALLIATFYMEMKLAYPLQRVAGVIALIWLAILLFGTLDDYLTRSWLFTPGR